jgi:hypothetical protein
MLNTFLTPLCYPEIGSNAFSEVFMIPLSSAVSSGFSISRISRGFEIRRSDRSAEDQIGKNQLAKDQAGNDQSAGTLQKPSFWSGIYIATTADGTWTFRRGGFLNAGSEIVDASQQIIARLKFSWGGKSELTFNDGQKFLIVSRGCWHPVWIVATGDGLPVLQLDAREKRVEVQTSALPDTRLSMLALFTLYCTRRAEEDGAMAVIAS